MRWGNSPCWRREPRGRAVLRSRGGASADGTLGAAVTVAGAGDGGGAAAGVRVDCGGGGGSGGNRGGTGKDGDSGGDGGGGDTADGDDCGGRTGGGGSGLPERLVFGRLLSARLRGAGMTSSESRGSVRRFR